MRLLVRPRPARGHRRLRAAAPACRPGRGPRGAGVLPGRLRRLERHGPLVRGRRARGAQGRRRARAPLRPGGRGGLAHHRLPPESPLRSARSADVLRIAGLPGGAAGPPPAWRTAVRPGSRSTCSARSARASGGWCTTGGRPAAWSRRTSARCGSAWR